MQQSADITDLCRRYAFCADVFERNTMTTSPMTQDFTEHFAHCIQVLGGTTAAARRLGIDERAIRRFINGERPISAGLMEDTAKALRVVIDDATKAEQHIEAALRAASNEA
jgi:DNA-binding transcriptional regulator YdaS (Cro superfamily)